MDQPKFKQEYPPYTHILNKKEKKKKEALAIRQGWWQGRGRGCEEPLKCPALYCRHIVKAVIPALRVCVKLCHHAIPPCLQLSDSRGTLQGAKGVENLAHAKALSSQPCCLLPELRAAKDTDQPLQGSCALPCQSSSILDFLGLWELILEKNSK